MVAIAALAFSAILIVLLCRGDPKRRRTAYMPGAGQSAMVRRILVATACLPGLLIALSGDVAAFLIWLGGTTAIGWFITLWFSRSSRERASSKSPSDVWPY